MRVSGHVPIMCAALRSARLRRVQAAQRQASAGARDGVKEKRNDLGARAPLHALVGRRSRRNRLAFVCAWPNEEFTKDVLVRDNRTDLHNGGPSGTNAYARGPSRREARNAVGRDSVPARLQFDCDVSRFVGTFNQRSRPDDDPDRDVFNGASSIVGNNDLKCPDNRRVGGRACKRCRASERDRKQAQGHEYPKSQ